MQNLINKIPILSCTLLIFLIEAACSAKVPVDESLTMYTNATWWDGEKSYAGPMYELRIRNAVKQGVEIGR